jgi:hypothetical protein
MTKYIYHHLGLGDHLICNGLVRNIAKNNNDIVLFCKDHNKESVKFMYRDLKNIKLHISNDENIILFLKENKVNVLKIGICGLGFPGNSDFVNNLEDYNLCHIFYRQAGLNIKERWDSWYVKRNKKRELLLFEKYNIDGEYIFVHGDEQRGYGILKEKLPNIRIIKPDLKLTNNIFDYCYLMENAKEIHCMDSCFRILCEHIDITGVLFFHQYCKNSFGSFVPLSKKKWNRISNVEHNKELIKKEYYK